MSQEEILKYLEKNKEIITEGYPIPAIDIAASTGLSIGLVRRCLKKSRKNEEVNYIFKASFGSQGQKQFWYWYKE